MEGLFGDFAAHDGDRFGQRNLFRADLDAVLGVAAVADAALFHEGAERSSAMQFADGMGIEKAHLGDGCGADELGMRVDLGHASLQQPQVMQVERTYITSWTLGLILGPKPRS